MTKEWNNEMGEEITIDVKRLIDAVQEKNGNTIGGAVFEDAYGDGVCLVNNVSYKTYTELAIAYSLNIYEYAL